MWKIQKRPNKTKQAHTARDREHLEKPESWLRRFARFMIRPLQVGVIVGLSLYILSWGQHLYEEHFGPYGGYNLMGVNYNDMAVSNFSVNDVWGANVFAGDSEGGGKSTCCLMISRDAKTAKVRWQISRTKEAIDRGDPEIHKEAQVPLPKFVDPHDGYIGVHFLPDDKVVLTHSKWFPKPLQPIKEIHYDFTGTYEAEDE